MTTGAHGLHIDPVRLKLYSLYCLCLLAALALSIAVQDRPDMLVSLVLTFVTGMLVPACLVFRRTIDFLEPIYWFAAMYYALFVGGVYFIFTDFAYSEHILIADPIARGDILQKALILILGGFACLMLGYYILPVDEDRIRVTFDSPVVLPGWLLMGAVAFALLIGLLNFLYVLGTYPGGVTGYFADIGLRNRRFDQLEEGVTTAGYQLYYAGVLISAFILLRQKQITGSFGSGKIWFPAIAIVSVIMLASLGRLFQTVSYVFCLIGIFYAASESPKRNKVMIVGGVLLLLLGLGLYLGRLLSVIAFNRPELFLQLGLLDALQGFVSVLGTILFDKGNVPDLASLMNIIAYWSDDFGMQFGVTFLSWVSAIVPGVEIQGIAALTKAAWHNAVGGWPPTVVGEMYANFGAAGVFFGMFALGYLMAYLYRLTRNSGNFWLVVIYVALLFKFFFILPKGEASNLSAAIFLFGPAIFIVAFCRVLASIQVDPSG